jgi:hypothetical protein
LIKIRNEQEKERYFNDEINTGGAYFNIKYPSGEKEFIWVRKFNNFTSDGSTWYLEFPNQLMKHDITGISLVPYYDEEDNETYIPFDHCYINETIAYEINSWQTSPFLPEEFEIEFVTDDEIEAIKHMIKLEKSTIFE